MSGIGVQSFAAVFIVLALVAALAWFARRGSFAALARKGRLITVETAVPLGERRTLVVIAVEGRRLLLGLTSTHITMVTELGAAAAAAPAAPSPFEQQLDATESTVLMPNALDLQVDGIGAVSAPLQVVLLLTLISFLPAILVTMTCFTRITIVFHFLRQALGTQEMPSNQILIGLTLFLTMFVMAPVGAQINELALAPAMAGKVTVTEALSRGTPPLRTFMLRQTRETDLKLFMDLGKVQKPQTRDQLPMTVVVPAYVISELKTGFQMGFFLFIPFLLIDLVVSTTLLSMGMLQLPPAMISLPFKVLLFVMIDGWNLVVGSIVRSFA